MIFDSHAHYEDEKFDSDRIELLSGMREKGIGTVVNVGSTIETSKKSIALAEQYEDVYAAIGVHPSEIGCLSEEGMEWLRERSAHPKVVAIGEIGLDYYWDKDSDVRLRQQDWFRRQLQLAAEVKTSGYHPLQRRGGGYHEDPAGIPRTAPGNQKSRRRALLFLLS